jgi:phospholipid/cholesterol/gamma-HCH transport system substrate-binding protein
LLNLNRLVESVDKRDLTVVIDELARAFAGTGTDLQAIIDSGTP